MAALVACTATGDGEGAGRSAPQNLVDSCEIVPPFSGNFDPELEWAWSGSPIMPSHNQVMMTPVVVEVNGDGIPDVVFNTFAGGAYTTNGVLRAISGDDGHDLWAVTDPNYRVNPGANIAAGDIDNDGLVEICTVAADQSGLICFENTGAFKFRANGSISPNYGAPALADLNGDGQVEIILGADVFNNQGAILWRGTGGSAVLPFAADIDQDGTQEVVSGRNIYSANGALKCAGTQPAAFSAVGNFDADPQGEIVLVGGGRVSLMDDNCATLWSTLVPGGGGGPPNTADFDNDGQPEIGVAGRSFYVVFETNGAVKWTSATRDFSSQATGSSTFDFEGDGRAEVIYGDEVRLRIYDGATGAIRFEVQHASGTIYENPVIVDVDGDNNAEIVMPANNYAFSGPTGIRVFRDRRDGWVNTRRIWNQHAYSVTNVNEDGTIPAHPAANWLTSGLNTFRSNSQGTGTTSPYAAADLIASNVAAVCDGYLQAVVLSAQVTNQGQAAASSGLQVAFFQGDPANGGTLLGVATLRSVLAAGASAPVSITLAPGQGSGLSQVVVVADYGTGTGRELECREDNNTVTAQMSLSCSCIKVRLGDANLFLLGDYTGGHDVVGKVAAGGNITLSDFAVGSGLPDANIANTLVAGGNLSLTRGGVWGDAWYGGSYSADPSVVYPRGTVAQGTPIDFAARFNALRAVSSRLAALSATGSTVRENWGGVMLRGTNPDVNVFDVSASAFNGAVLWSIEAPAGSFAVVNIRGAAASFGGFGIQFGGGIDQHGVLFNFVDATSINAQGFGFWGTVLAPYADVHFTNGSFDGGIYAKSLTGNAEGHINPLNDRDICE